MTQPAVEHAVPQDEFAAAPSRGLAQALAGQGGEPVELSCGVVETDLTLRAADEQDAGEMLAVIRAAFAARRLVDPPAAALSDSVDDVRARLRQLPGVIAELHGELVGCLLLSLTGSLAGLHRVSVLPQYRRSGIAEHLVRGAVELCTDLGARDLELLCRREFPETRRWWEAHGFRVSRDHPDGWMLSRRLPARVEVPTGEAMQHLGARLARLLQPGDVLIASGELGAGKTTLAQGVGAGLQVDQPVISPTFVLSRVHPSLAGGPDFVHVDAYRLDSVAEVEDLDLEESLATSVTLVEWGVGVAEGLSGDRLDIDIQRSADLQDETRVVYLSGVGDRWSSVDLLEEMQ